MKKKITIIDKSFTPIVVLADTSSALYEDRCGRLGERNLLSDTEIICVLRRERQDCRVHRRSLP